jgi:hypothetical protein
MVSHPLPNCARFVLPGPPWRILTTFHYMKKLFTRNAGPGGPLDEEDDVTSLCPGRPPSVAAPTDPPAAAPPPLAALARPPPRPLER